MSLQLNSSFSYTPSEYREKLNSIRIALSENHNDNAWAFDKLFPEPISIDPNIYVLLESFCHSIARAGKAVVENYYHDERIREVLKLSEKSHKIVEALKDQPYPGVGTLRPDIILDQDNFPRMCEVNARFPLNGFLFSTLLHQAAVEFAGPESLFIAQKEIIKELLPEKDILIIKGRERGMDILVFAEEMRKKGFNIEYLPPIEEVLRRKLANTEWNKQKVVFEIHQSEIETISPEILAELNQKVHLNDLRTVLILHDKRLMALLTENEIMKDYLSEEDINNLKSIIIPTFVVGLSPDIKVEALANKDLWVLKPNLLGKSVGIVVGKSVDQKTWEKYLNNSEFSDFILQPFIKSNEVSLPYLKKDGDLSYFQTKIVGTLLQFNDTFFGPGLFRGGMGDVLWDSRYVIIPAISSGNNQKVQFEWKQ